jgi:peptide/nickel transport system substrate-binding protein
MTVIPPKHRHSRRCVRIFGCAAFAAFAACDATHRADGVNEVGGTIVIAATGEPDALFPPLAGLVSAFQVNSLVYDHLADIGPKLNVLGDAGFTPALADSWTWAPDSLSIAFHLNPKARWHDGVPVTAEDVVYTHHLNTSPRLGNPMGDELGNIDSVVARNRSTAVFWFHARAPEQFYTAAGMMLILPKHVFAKLRPDSLMQDAPKIKPVGSGRFRFVSWTPGVSLEIAADTGNYRGRPPLDRVIWSFSSNYLSAVTKLAGGEADVFDALHAETEREVAQHPRLHVLVLTGMDYAFLNFNLRDPVHHDAPNPLFASRELRRALTMATDRSSMVRNVFDTLGAVSVGPAIRALPTTSPSLIQIPYDTVRAGRILDSLGWTSRTKDGIREKNGRALAFTVIVPTSSSARNRMAVMLQSQLLRVGVRLDIEKLEFQSFHTREEARSFDAELNAWHMGPSASALREAWTTKASRKAGGRNYGAYENPHFDAEVDSAGSSLSPANIMMHYTRAYQTIIDDAPAIWLYEPKTILGLHRRIRVRGMTPAAWWAGVGTWSIDPADRIPRDQLGARK